VKLIAAREPVPLIPIFSKYGIDELRYTMAPLLDQHALKSVAVFYLCLRVDQCVFQPP
jgi:hypothetical protein